MSNVNVREIQKYNGKQVEVRDVVGPFASGNGCKWYLVQAYMDGVCIGNAMYGKPYMVLEEPISDSWFDLQMGTSAVHYALADALKRLQKALDQALFFAEIRPDNYDDDTLYARSTFDQNPMLFRDSFPELAAELKRRVEEAQE